MGGEFMIRKVCDAASSLSVLGCCSSTIIELNPDGTPKEPQTKEQRANDPR
jgi:hypothetical protein